MVVLDGVCQTASQPFKILLGKLGIGGYSNLNPFNMVVGSVDF